MTRRIFFNFAAIFFVIALGSGMFILKYQVIKKEKQLEQIHRQIKADKREIHMLNADWALLNDPERLRVLVEKQTDFKIIRAGQVIETADLPVKAAETGGGGND